MRSMKKSYEMDMTHGPLLGKIIRYAIPLMLSSLAQTLFTTVDTMVVGRYAGSEALAAVGSTGTYVGFVTNFFIGLSLGVNVAIAQSFAAKEDRAVSDIVHTSILAGFFFGILTWLLGEWVSPAALHIMGSPEDVFDLALLYVRIRFFGAPIVILYNFAAAILRSIGDTRRPLLFQLIAGVINAVLNVYLVLRWDLGVAGVAIATVFSQLVSCVCVFVVLLRAEGAYRLSFKKLAIHGKSLSRVLQIGVPTGIQSIVISFSNLLIQSSVNSFGSLTMAAFSVCTSTRSYVYQIVHAFSQTATSFVGQNYGVRDFKRIRRIGGLCFGLVASFGLFFGLLFSVFSKPIAGLFSTDPEVIDAASSVMFLITAPYLLYGLVDLFGSCMRGMNHSVPPMLFNILGTLILRVSWVYFVFPHFGTFTNLMLSYPVSWGITTVLQYTAYRIVYQKERRAWESR